MKLSGTKNKLMLVIMQSLINLKENKNYEVEIKEQRNKRSIKANSYAWQLISEIAENMNISKEEIYEKMLQDYGTNLTDENEEIITISTKQQIKSNEDLHVSYIGTSYLNNIQFYHYRVIKGSSQYNSKEMYTFIEGLKRECENLGIETRSIEEIKSMCEVLDAGRRL